LCGATKTFINLLTTLHYEVTDYAVRSRATPTPHRGVQEFLKELGPGLITGAAGDDPSCISTYSVAGAAYAMP